MTRLAIAALGLMVALVPAVSCAEPAAGPRAPQRVYEVKPGDTLTSLAKRYGVNVVTLVKLNKLKEAIAPLEVAVAGLKDPPAPPAAYLALAECLLEGARPADVEKVLVGAERALAPLPCLRHPLS